MADITRDDLRWRCRDVCCDGAGDRLDRVTDEEFDVLILERIGVETVNKGCDAIVRFAKQFLEIARTVNDPEWAVLVLDVKDMVELATELGRLWRSAFPEGDSE